MVGGGGSLFEAGCLLKFPSHRKGTYLKWALIRVWVLNRINTVNFIVTFVDILAFP